MTKVTALIDIVGLANGGVKLGDVFDCPKSALEHLLMAKAVQIIPDAEQEISKHEAIIEQAPAAKPLKNKAPKGDDLVLPEGDEAA